MGKNKVSDTSVGRTIVSSRGSSLRMLFREKGLMCGQMADSIWEIGGLVKWRAWEYSHG